MADIRHTLIVSYGDKTISDLDFDKSANQIYSEMADSSFPENLKQYAAFLDGDRIKNYDAPLNCFAREPKSKHLLVLTKKLQNIDPCGNSPHIIAKVRTLPKITERSMCLHTSDSLSDIFNIPKMSHCIIDGITVDPNKPIRTYVGYGNLKDCMVVLIDKTVQNV